MTGCWWPGEGLQDFCELEIVPISPGVLLDSFLVASPGSFCPCIWLKTTTALETASADRKCDALDEPDFWKNSFSAVSPRLMQRRFSTFRQRFRTCRSDWYVRQVLGAGIFD